MEKYTAPEMEVVEFEAEDVITTSNPDCPLLDETGGCLPAEGYPD